jgi:phenylalanyl-tRNA synthetase beta chain
MKVLYSQIKELVPDLQVTPKEVGEALTLTGFMMDGFTEVSYKGKTDYLLGLEIRQNRADCLSVIGLAREVGAYFNLPVVIPEVGKVAETGKQLDIKVEATDYVKRVLAVEIDGITNGESPAWLKEYVEFYGLNSVSLLVDLSNYVMLVTGYPSHLIDYKKTNGQIAWALNEDFDEVTTLMGAQVKLQKNNEILIRDEKNILALAGIVGGVEAAIGTETQNIIAEIAIYDRSIIRKNSRSLNVVTEASHRLEKELDPNGADYAMNLLVSLILEHSGGKVSSDFFSYYPEKYVSPTIEFKAEMPSRFAGVEISEADSLKIFESLGFVSEKKENYWLVTPPTFRLDLTQPEDLVEEVVRIFGYDRIPSHEIPHLEVVKDITPKNIILVEEVREILRTLGFDEILSWPLVKVGDNESVNYADWQMVATQNSVNDLFPNLRQSMITGLLNQLDEYGKKNVDFVNIFETGKIFGEKNGEYLERESLGIMATSDGKALNEFKNKVESLLRLVGFADIKYFEAKAKPAIANPGSCWDIYAGTEAIGIIYKLALPEVKANVYFVEINIDKITELLGEIKNNPVVEITQKLITLDVNVELGSNESIYEYLGKLERKMNKKHIWSVNVADVYPLGDKIRYTLRVTYQELSDQEAKKIHLETFGLN